MVKDDWLMVAGLITLLTLIFLPIGAILSWMGLMNGNWVMYILGIGFFAVAIIHSEVCPERYYPIDIGGDKIG